MSLNKAIEIAKKIDPSIGPALDIDRKNLSEAELSLKLGQFFAAYKKAAEFKLTHPKKSKEELTAMVEENTTAHVNNDFHIATFVGNVLAKKGDLETLSGSAARRIVLSDPRISDYFKANPKADKIQISQTIDAEIKKLLVDYFVNLKGRQLDPEAITDDLTTGVTRKVAELINKF